MTRPATTRRDRVYDILREAGDRGVTHRELAEEHSIGHAMAHVESLRFEGHLIEDLSGVDARGRQVRRLWLRHDAWADETASEAA